jgi:glycosyltransferase involved in cell wall biosynthesis
LISLIIPARDEPGIDDFTANLADVLEYSKEKWEIIIVMGDKETLHMNPLEKPNITTIKCYGDSLERSILTGFSASHGDKVIVMDADGSHEARDILVIVDKLDEYEMVVGSRFIPKSRFNQSKARKFVSYSFLMLARMRGSHLSDPMSGFFGIRRSILDRMKFKPFKWKVCLEIELKAKPSIFEFPINFQERREGLSKSSVMTGLALIWDVITG